MAFSASYDFVVTRDDIISAALRKLGVLAEGQSPSTNQLTAASQALNVMLKAWKSDSLPLWYVRTGYIYPIHSVNSVDLHSSGGHWSEELILTKTTAAAAASATSISVSITAANDVVGTTANSDNVGIELTDGTIHWTTISSGGGTATLTIASGLASAAASGNRVYAYTAKAQRPEAIVNAYRVHAGNQNRVELDPTAIGSFFALGNLHTEGPPTTWNYQETVAAVPGSTPGVFRFWPRFDGGDYFLEVRFVHPFDDLDAASNNLSFPDTWYEAVIYGLSLRLADEYQVSDNVYQRIGKAAMSLKQEAEGSTTETNYIRVMPETRRS